MEMAGSISMPWRSNQAFWVPVLLLLRPLDLSVLCVRFFFSLYMPPVWLHLLDLPSMHAAAAGGRQLAHHIVDP
jgi:hypothetical protein